MGVHLISTREISKLILFLFYFLFYFLAIFFNKFRNLQSQSKKGVSFHVHTNTPQKLKIKF
jgi:hypothetical protein